MQTKTGTTTNLESGLSGSNLQLDSGILQQQVLQQQMLQMQQRAFLASSLQQNLEIQKQLLQQNEQLQMLLAQTVGTPTPTPPVNDSAQMINRSTSLSSVAFPISPIPNPIFGSNPMLSTLPEVQNNNNNSKSDINKAPKISILSPVVGNGNGQIPPPPPPPPMSPGTDVFGRAKTVRIGKWRWPPPAEGAEGQVPASNFMEFKRKKQKEKDSSKNSSEVSSASCSDFKSSTDSSAVDIQFEVTKKEAIIISPGSSSTSSTTNETTKIEKIEKEIVVRKFSDTSSTTPVPGSVGKLRISSEMRAKLEQLTIDQTVRGPKKGVTGTKEQVSQSMDDLAGMSSVKKLSEQRKALLERQLMGSLRNTANFMETASTPNIKQVVDAPEVQDVNVLMGHKKLAQENSASSAGYDPPSHVKKFLKNQPEPMRKSGSREFRERREELGFNRLSSSAVHVNYPPEMRPLYTPDRYFQSQQNVNNSSFQAEVESGRPSSSSGRYFSGRKQLHTPVNDHRDQAEHKIDKLFMKNEINFYTYSKPKFRLNLRKEFFTPNENIENPILVDMIFWQIVRDCFSSNCLRFNQTEQQHLMKILKSEGITNYAPHPHGPKSSFKRTVIETVKGFNLYFSRLHVVTGTKRFTSMDYFAVSHHGICIVRRERNSQKLDELIVLERISFEDMKEICVPERFSLQIVYRDEWATFHTKEASNIHDLLQKILQELKNSQIEFVRTVREYVANDQSSLSYAKDTIIKIIKNKHVHLQKGMFFFVLFCVFNSFSFQFSLPPKFHMINKCVFSSSSFFLFFTLNLDFFFFFFFVPPTLPCFERIWVTF